MFFGEPPSFDDILDVVGEFERGLNARVGPTSPRT
jgi:hypothetical protein